MTVIDTYSRAARSAEHIIATGPCPMSPPTVPDGLETKLTSSGFVIIPAEDTQATQQSDHKTRADTEKRLV